MAIPLIIWAGIIFVALIVLLWFFPVTLWFQAILSGVHIPLIQLVLMRWRGVNPNTIVIAMITGTKAGLKLRSNELGPLSRQRKCGEGGQCPYLSRQGQYSARLQDRCRYRPRRP